MDRRIVLAGLAAAAVSPALAQTREPPATMQPAQPGGATAGAARSGGQMSQADMQHMQQTMMLGMIALETSKIALEKARNEDLKRFAKFEVDEQTTLSEVLRSMMDPAATAATTGATTAAQPTGGMPMQMDAKDREMVQKLTQTSGAEFDREYLQGQIEGHRDLLQVQERYLSANPQSREHMNVAKLARGQIREHIALLDNIQKKILSITP